MNPNKPLTQPIKKFEKLLRKATVTTNESDDAPVLTFARKRHRLKYAMSTFQPLAASAASDEEVAALRKRLRTVRKAMRSLRNVSFTATGTTVKMTAVGRRRKAWKDADMFSAVLKSLLMDAKVCAHAGITERQPVYDVVLELKGNS